MGIDFSTRYGFENLCYFCRQLLSGKASLGARALPSHTRDLSLSGQNLFKVGSDAPPYEFRTFLPTRSLAGYN
jgi:hypothetical protein